jgi:hypothetical protein
MVSGDMSDDEILKLNPLFEEEIHKSEYGLVDVYYKLIRNLSIGHLEDVNNELGNKFVQSKGNKEFEDKRLTDFVKDHESTIRFINGIKDNIAYKLGINPYFTQEKLEIDFKEKKSYELPSDPNAPMNKRNDIPSPGWGGNYLDKAGGLGIAVNDTWGYEVKINKFILDKTNKHYVADLEIEIFDHYGLDSKDVDPTIEIKKKFAEDPGFRAWFYLQHSPRYQYRPFITVVKFNIQVNGEY